MFTCKILPKGKTDEADMIDITGYVVSYDWSGDVTQAARKLEFSIVYNTKDKGFINQNIILGDKVYLYYQEDTKKAGTEETKVEIFRGMIFYRDRNTTQFTFSYTAYDDLRYLAKSKTSKKFSSPCTVENVIEQVANEMGITVGGICPIGIDVEFIADKMSCTEIIQKAFSLASAQTGKKYHVFMKEGKLNVIEQSQKVEEYTATDAENVDNTEHSESVEDMISTVKIVDADGNEVGRVSNDEDMNAYGKVQDVYKEDPKQDTATAAKAMLKTVAFKSTLNGVGNTKCIAGYAITVKEEQLKGVFTIKSDQHSIAGNVHKMTLDLEFLKEAEA